MNLPGKTHIAGSAMVFAAALMGGIATPAQADTPHIEAKQVFIQDGADNTIVAEKKELNLKTDDTTVIEEDDDFGHFPHHDLFDHDLDHHDLLRDNEIVLLADEFEHHDHHGRHGRHDNESIIIDNE
ncbi:hypothetical protein OG851_43410 (plasmid) [Streptomyces sp. NBC_00161]|uniref:hypothetical protein n=1 Tax=Streptomyces sp. NBC_00161 TaxID=2975671 RepID=UPI002F90ABC2